MTTIKQETLDNIEQSRVIMSNVVKYGNRAKISFTWHTDTHAFTIEAWAALTFNKQVRLTTWCALPSLAKPYDFTGYMESKVTGESKRNEDQAKCKLVFRAVCDELAKRSDSVHLDQYLLHNKND